MFLVPENSAKRNTNMECTIAALIACFSWSNLYIDGGLQLQDAEVPRSEWRTTVNHGGNAVETVTSLHSWNDNQNPYGRLSLGYAIELPRITLSLELSHSSSLSTTKDRGVNAVQLRARWFPFR